ncbi:hypothetical protein [Pseudorhodobacter ferrugineus]|nr:hypothetical protein [Pseudorhodobacter ferrugineus]
MLREMERDFGLHDLSASELDVFLAANALAGNEGASVTSDDIHRHELASGLAQATYHRALKSLLSRGLLETADGYKTTLYKVRTDLIVE